LTVGAICGIWGFLDCRYSRVKYDYKLHSGSGNKLGKIEYEKEIAVVSKLIKKGFYNEG